MIARFLRGLLGATAEARSKANAEVSDQIGPKLPDAERRARNLAKLEARKAEAAAKHRATMATKPGARS